MQATETVMGRRLAPRAGLVSEQVSLMAGVDAGQPPAHVRAAAKAALDAGQTHYTVGPGILPLRQAIAERSTVDGFPASAESVVVTNGGSEALYIALQSVLKAGDRIAVAGPVAPNVLEMIAFIGAKALRLSGEAHTGFMPTLDEVAGCGARSLLLASPSPVSGMAIPTRYLRDLVALAVQRDMAVIFDRTLAWCCFEPATAHFPDAELGARVLTTGSFSEAYAMHGWRVDYFSAAGGHLAVMRELKQAMSICTSSMSQFAALAALEGPTDWLDERRQAFVVERERVASLCAALDIELLSSDAWPSVLLQPRGTTTAAELQQRLGVPVEAAERYGAALRGYFRALLSVQPAGRSDS